MLSFPLFLGEELPQALKGCPASKDPVRRTDRPTFKIGLIVIGLLQEGLEVVEDFLLPQVVKDFLCVVFPGQSFSGKQSDKPLRTLPPSVPHIPHTHPTDQSTGRQTFRPSVSWEVSALCWSPGLLPTLRAQASSVPGALRESF